MISAFILLFSALTFAQVRDFELPFSKQDRILSIHVVDGSCGAPKQRVYKFLTKEADKHYRLDCQLPQEYGEIDASVEVKLVTEPDTKNLKMTEHSWGQEFSKDTLSYLCPKNSKDCFKVDHPVTEVLQYKIIDAKEGVEFYCTFEIRALKTSKVLFTETKGLKKDALEFKAKGSRAMVAKTSEGMSLQIDQAKSRGMVLELGSKGTMMKVSCEKPKSF
jgi:hypothetical protein